MSLNGHKLWWLNETSAHKSSRQPPKHNIVNIFMLLEPLLCTCEVLYSSSLKEGDYKAEGTLPQSSLRQPVLALEYYN